jgi:cation:H+ antiporter
MTLGLLTLQFLLCAVLIAGAGYVLCQSADRIAKATGLTTVTSLPELASGISAVTVIEAPNLAVGNALGACVVNLVFLVVIDALQRRQPIYRHASAAHLLSAAFGVVMLGFVAMSLLLPKHAPTLLHLGLYSPVLLAQMMGWSRSFVGTLFMAFVTTLPEIAVTLSALRLRALDMAIGNLLGSNLFNVTILAIDDLFYTRGPLLADASPVHGGTAIAAVVMSGLVMIGLVMRPQGRELRVLSWVSAGLLATYLFNAALVFLYGGA